LYFIDILNITKFIQFLKGIKRNPITSHLPPWGKAGIGVFGYIKKAGIGVFRYRKKVGLGVTVLQK